MSNRANWCILAGIFLLLIVSGAALLIGSIAAMAFPAVANLLLLSGLIALAGAGTCIVLMENYA